MPWATISRCLILFRGLREKSTRLLAAACVSFFMLSLAGPETPEARPGSPAVYAAVWQVFNNESTGTAFAIGDNRFMTNAHVMKGFIDTGDMSIFLTQKGNARQLRFHRLVAISTTYDLAIFETREIVDHYLKFANGSGKGEWGLYVVGYPQESFTVLEQTEKIAFEDGFSYEFAVNSMGAEGKLGGLSGAPILNHRDEVVMISFSQNSNMLSGIKREVARQLIAGENEKGVACSFTESSSQCFQRAIRQTTEMGGRGHAIAQYQLGSGHSMKTGENQDWLAKAAQSGSSRAQQILGFNYKDQGDPAGAFEWFQKSGRSIAMYELFLLLYRGKIPGGARERAFSLAMESANAGYNLAQFAVGWMLYHGRGTAPDRESARFWLIKSAATGYAKAKKFLRDNFR